MRWSGAAGARRARRQRVRRRHGVVVGALLMAAAAGCGGGEAAGTGAAGTTAAAAPARPAVHVFSPAPGTVVAADRADDRLRAFVRLSGSAAAGQQLTVTGECGGLECGGLTFADTDGRWRTRLPLYTAPGEDEVAVTVAYAQPRPGERPARTTLRLRVEPAPPEAAPQPLPEPGQEAEPEDGARRPRGPRPLILIGDSLAVGIAQALPAALPGWSVSIDARIGRPLAEGMAILTETPLPEGAAGARAILAFSLFTNDDPSHVDALEQAVRASVARLGAHGCALWATIQRPPYNGVSYDAANRRLHALAGDPALAGRLLIVPWHEAVARHPEWLGDDQVHATPDGWAGRARLYARAARACAR